MVQINGYFFIDGEPDAVWRVLMDPDTLCSLAESCEEARRLDETHYEGIVRIKLPLVSFRGNVRGEILDMRPPTWMRVALEGHTEGLPGTFRGTAELTMRGSGNQTRGHYSYNMSLLGKLGSLGQPFLAKAADRLANSFSAKVSRHLRQTGSPPASSIDALL